MGMKKTALITGASSGIGFALADEFAMHGYNLVLVSRDEVNLNSAVERLRTKHGVHGIIMTPIVKDLTKEHSCQELFDEVRDMRIRIDVLVNDAGVGKGGLFYDIPLAEHVQVLRLNVEALTTLTSLFLTEMKMRDMGMVLNLGSVAGFQPGPLLAVYHATKAYVVSFTEALAEELKDTGITVSCLCPGPTSTHFFENANMMDANVVHYGNMTMMKPEEVAHAGYEGLMERERIIIPGAMNKIMTFTRRLIPLELQAKVNKKFYEQHSEE